MVGKRSLGGNREEFVRTMRFCVKSHPVCQTCDDFCVSELGSVFNKSGISILNWKEGMERNPFDVPLR